MPRKRSELRLALLLFAAWTVVGLYNAVELHFQTAAGPRPYTWRGALFNEVSYAYIAGALTPFVLWMARRFPIERQHRIRNLCLHILSMCVFAATAKVFWDLVAGPPTGYLRHGFTFEKLIRSINWGFDMGMMLYWAIVLIVHASRYYRRYEVQRLEALQLQAQLAHAQLENLKMQLHPHFLFNALNGISALVQEDPERAENMIARLSELLRRSLESNNLQEVPLSDEVDFTNLYLDIERMRFDDRLTVNYDIDPHLNDVLVPNLILQPLVENSIRHGISNRTANGLIEISAQQRNGSLILTVMDNGTGLPAESEKNLREGVGLSATRGRLERLYGTKQRLELQRAETGGVAATIQLPIHREPTNHNGHF